MRIGRSCFIRSAFARQSVKATGIIVDQASGGHAANNRVCRYEYACPIRYKRREHRKSLVYRPAGQLLPLLFLPATVAITSKAKTFRLSKATLVLYCLMTEYIFRRKKHNIYMVFSLRDRTPSPKPKNNAQQFCFGKQIVFILFSSSLSYSKELITVEISASIQIDCFSISLGHTASPVFTQT